MGIQARAPQDDAVGRQAQPPALEQDDPRSADRAVPVSRPISKPRLRPLKSSLLKGILLGPLQVGLLILLALAGLATGGLGALILQPAWPGPPEFTVQAFLLLAAALLVTGLLFVASLRRAIQKKALRRIDGLAERLASLEQGAPATVLGDRPDDEIGRAESALAQFSEQWSRRQAEMQAEALALRREVSELRQSEAGCRQKNEELSERLGKSRAELESESRRLMQIEANLRSNLEMMVLLYHIIAVTSSTLDPQKAMEAFCRELAGALDLPQAAYAELSADRESLTVTAEYCRPGRPSALGAVIPVNGNLATQQVLQTRQPLVVQNAQLDPRQAVIHALEHQRGTVSLLIAPICVRGEVTGTLGLDSLVERQFTPDEVALVQNCATGLAQALDNLYLYNALQKELAEKRRVEQDLRDSEARYRQSVENSPNPIFIVDRSGSLQSWSRACERVFQQGQEVVGLDFAALLAQPHDRERLGALIRQVYDLGRSADGVDILYRRLDGSTRFMVARLYPLTDRDGRVDGCVVANTDLTEYKLAEDEIRRRTLQLEVLRNATLELTAELDLETLLSRVAGRSGELLGAERSGIYLYDPQADTLVFRVRSGEGSPPLGMILKRGEGLVGRVLERRNPLMVDDYSAWEGRSGQMDDYPTGAMIGAPVIWREEILGVLSVSSTNSYRFTRSDIELLGLFANQAAIAIRNARVVTAEERQRRRAEAMARAAADLSSTLETQSLLDIAVRSAAAAFPQADFGMILMRPPAVEGGSEKLDGARPPFSVLETGMDAQAPESWTAERLAEVEATWKRVFQDATPVFIPDLQRPGRTGHLSLGRLRSAIGAPLKQRERVAGILWLSSSQAKEAFLDEDLSLLEALANQTAIAVDNADLYHQARASENALRYEALHDPLTGLPNRIYFLDKLRLAIERLRRSNRQTAALLAAEGSPPKQPAPEAQAAVLFLDLDRFKIVNDSLGHAAGDRLLVEIAGRLAGRIRAGDIVARFGGDEFAVLLENIQAPEEAAQAAAAILTEISQPAAVNRHTVSTTASIGIALTGGVKRSAEEILREADIAMYHAKANGKARYEFYRPEMGLETASALELENDLRRALSEQELRLVYQPVVDLASGERVEMEELLRWAHPKRGLLLPEEFLPAAQESGLIGQISRWVIQETVRQQRLWSQAGLPAPVAINVPARLQGYEAVVHEVEAILAEEALPPGSLALDIAEPASEGDSERLAAVLSRLRAEGVWINLEHFCSGGSSLSILKRLPADGLKIPRSLVLDLPGSDRDMAVVEALIRMGHALGLVVTGVGVETEEQAACLRSLGCDRAQGNWVSGPAEPASG